MMSAWLSYASAATALIAAFCWARAATAFVPAPGRADDSIGVSVDGAIVIMVGKNRTLLYPTLELQSRWNARGAGAAAIAALCSALATFVVK